jgi:transposase InsO family protein
VILHIFFLLGLGLGPNPNPDLSDSAIRLHSLRPVRTSQSKRRRYYYIVYIDDFSRYTEVHFLVTKGAAEITSKFKTFKAAVENKGYIIRRFRCDNGTGEYNNAEFQKVLTDAGIQYEPAPAYTQHKNGVAERRMRKG